MGHRSDALLNKLVRFNLFDLIPTLTSWKVEILLNNSFGHRLCCIFPMGRLKKKGEAGALRVFACAFYVALIWYVDS